MIQRVRKGSLRLQVTYPADRASASDKSLPRFVSEVRHLLLSSGLKSTQWTMGVESAVAPDVTVAAEPAAGQTGAAAKPAPAMVPPPLRCDLTSFQDF